MRQGLGLSVVREIGEYGKAQYEQLDTLDLQQFANLVMLERLRMSDLIDQIQHATFG